MIIKQALVDLSTLKTEFILYSKTRIPLMKVVSKHTGDFKS